MYYINLPGEHSIDPDWKRHTSGAYLTCMLSNQQLNFQLKSWLTSSGAPPVLPIELANSSRRKATSFFPNGASIYMVVESSVAFVSGYLNAAQHNPQRDVERNCGTLPECGTFYTICLAPRNRVTRPICANSWNGASRKESGNTPYDKVGSVFLDAALAPYFK